MKYFTSQYILLRGRDENHEMPQSPPTSTLQPECNTALPWQLSALNPTAGSYAHTRYSTVAPTALHHCTAPQHVEFHETVPVRQHGTSLAFSCPCSDFSTAAAFIQLRSSLELQWGSSVFRPHWAVPGRRRQECVAVR